MNAPLDTGQLAAFDRIVRDGSFGRAAIALGIGQPAVSARIRALELILGGALFTRGRRIALTALGEAFLPFARRALEVIGEGAKAAHLAQTGGRGKVRLGTLASLAGGLVGPALHDFLSTSPEVACTVKAGDHEFIVGLLLDGVIDLGVVAWPCTEAEAADLEPLLVFHEPVVLVASPRHTFASRGSITTKDLSLARTPLFRLRWWQSHHPEIDRLVQRTGTVMELPMETARQLALSGTGTGFFAKTYITEDFARRDLVEVTVTDFGPVYRDSALVRRGTAPLSPAAAHLIQALRRQAHRLGLLERARRPKAGGAKRVRTGTSPANRAKRP